MAKERPILFSAEMMRRILDPDPGRRKTQTRRVIKPQPPPETAAYSWLISTDKKRDGCFVPRRAEGEDGWTAEQLREAECGPPVRCPYGSPGDVLWCRETWAANDGWDDYPPSKIPPLIYGGYRPHKPTTWYRANDPEDAPWRHIGRWRPSIHMPRWASRATLEVTELRAERLQDITEEDARAEGFRSRAGFIRAWVEMHGPESWAGPMQGPTSRWVWVVSFSLLQPAPAS